VTSGPINFTDSVTAVRSALEAMPSIGHHDVDTLVVPSTVSQFSYTFAGFSSQFISTSDSPATVQAILEAMPPIGKANVQVFSTGPITETTGGLVAGGLRVNSTGQIVSLQPTSGTNAVGTVAANVAGSFALTNAGNPLAVGTVDGLVGITTNNSDVLLRSIVS